MLTVTIEEDEGSSIAVELVEDFLWRPAMRSSISHQPRQGGSKIISPKSKKGMDSHHHGLPLVITTTYGERQFLSRFFCSFDLLNFWLVNF